MPPTQFPGSATSPLRGTIMNLLAIRPPDAEDDATAARGLAEGFFRRSDEVYVLHRKADVLMKQWHDLYGFVRLRAPGEILVRAFAPNQEAHGFSVQRGVVQTCVEDQPFLFATVKMALEELGAAPLKAIHPVLGVRRDGAGRLVHVEPLPQSSTGNESMMHFEIPLPDDPARLAEIEAALRHRLRLAQAVVTDFSAMRERARWIAGHLGEYLGHADDATYRTVAVVQRFFHWLVDDRFVLQGYREFDLGADGSAGAVHAALGIDRLGTPEDPLLASLLAATAASRGVLVLGKGARGSLIHRQGKVDLVGVVLREEGKPARVALFTGLYTAKALHDEVSRIPLLKEKLDAVIQASAALEGSHLHGSIQQSFRALPVEFLLGADVGAVERATRLVMTADDAGESGAHLLVDGSGRSAFVVVSVPRDLYDDGVRTRLADTLRATLGANYLDWRLTFGQTGNVVVLYYLTAPDALKVQEELSVQAAVARVAQSWEQRFLHELRGTVEADRADSLAGRYASAFPPAYELAVPPGEAVADVGWLEQLRQSGELQVSVRHADADSPGVHRLYLYQRQKIYLTESTPVLDHFGLRVIDQVSWLVTPEDGETCTIDCFRITSADARVAAEVLADPITDVRLAEAIQAALLARTQDDLLHQLVISAGLAWREIEVLRLYIAYARQLGAAVPYDVVRRTWCRHPEIARVTIELFKARFDPALPDPQSEQRLRAVVASREALLAALSRVEQAADDRLLRRTYNLIEATLRTNYWAGARLTGHPLSVKIDCSKVEDMPLPRPYREIFVHHDAIEGVHLRGGPVARGGLRWSDRPEDYRTEILGLMATQMVKNVLIVPVGAKGGFILRRSYATFKEARVAADELYKVFIRGLLDVTDNVVDGAVVPPRAVVRYDADDPYLVVAADKGTAHLSNTANSISAAYGFWLGDAFASGGSQGYDHKLYAITAKGAWVCTRRHFREIGLDPERDPITAIGIGDMSGDVFGNGLLLSQTVRLKAAFDHRHIFLDPNPPDGVVAWTERKRLFDLPGSSWDDYSRSLISEGGGIFPKNARSVPLTPQVRAMLSTQAEEMSGEAVVRAILGMEVDLLWNGGIGTYFKASHESHRDAADSANDAVRLDARDLRFKVVGEGGNLGFTQAARVEFARLGGRINTDALDNSGGVDMSDHEVNLKILFQDTERSGAMTREDRNALLKRIAPDVSEAVQADNYHHSLMISLDLLRSRQNVEEFRVVLRELEAIGVHRGRNALPDDAEVQRRGRAGESLWRPELCRVGPWVKMGVYDALREDPRFFVPYVRRWLREYFPAEVRREHGEYVERHQLRVDIAATVVTNYLVDALGATHFSRLCRLTGRTVTEVAFASLCAYDLLDAWTLSESLRDRPDVRADDEYGALLRLTGAVAALAQWLLQRGIDVWEPDTVLSRFSDGFRQYESQLETTLDRTERAAFQESLRALRAAGFVDAHHGRVAMLPWVVEAGEAVLLAERWTGLDIGAAGALLRTVAGDVGATRIRALCPPGEAADAWEARAAAELSVSVAEAVSDLAGRALDQAPQQGRALAAAVDPWATFADGRRQALDRIGAIAEQIEQSGGRGLAPASVLFRALRDLR